MDGDEGEKRVTLADNFRLYGGSERSHEEMQRLLLRIENHLAQGGRSLADIGQAELLSLLDIVDDEENQSE